MYLLYSSMQGLVARMLLAEKRAADAEVEVAKLRRTLTHPEGLSNS